MARIPFNTSNLRLIKIKNILLAMSAVFLIIFSNLIWAEVKNSSNSASTSNPEISTQKITMVIQESTPGREILTLPIFENNQGVWNSIVYKDFMSVNGGVVDNTPLVRQLETWCASHPINIKEFHLVEKGDYEGWMGNKEVKIYLSKPLDKNAQTWKKKPPTAEALAKAVEQFKKTYPKIDYSWTTKDLKLIDSYNSSKGAWLIGLIMNKEPDGLPEDEFVPNWFYVENNKSKLIGQYLYPLKDFSVDGKALWIMGYGGYNQDGYVLWEDNFTKKHEFNYGFH